MKISDRVAELSQAAPASLKAGLPRRAGLLAALLPLALAAFAQSAADPAPLHIVERADWSRYRDGRYLGHTYHESRLTLYAEALQVQPSAGPTAGRYAGDYFVLEETLRDLRAEARRLDASGRSSIYLGRLGTVDPPAASARGVDSPVPSLRGLLDLSRSSYRKGLPDVLPDAPATDTGELLPLGASFVAPGLRLVELRDGSLALPFLAEYRVVQRGAYADRPALLVKAKFATRLATPQGSVKGASGSHDLDIWIDLETGLPLFVRDLFDETFAYSDGGTERRAGSSLTFWKGGDAGGRTALIASLGGKPGGAAGGTAPVVTPPAPPATVFPSSQDGSDDAPAPDDEAAAPALGAGSAPVQAGPELGMLDELARDGVDLSQGESGLVLRISDLQFKADSSELLPAEKSRLDLVARALAAAPGGHNLLVEGHAASAGKPQGELALSAERARRIVDELVARGLPASRFIWRGLGSTRPVAPNDSEAGRARNRRVEITILD